MKVLIKKTRFTPFFFVDSKFDINLSTYRKALRSMGTSVSMGIPEVTEVEMSPTLVRELEKFHRLFQDVQKFLEAHFSGRFTPESQIKHGLKKFNDTHNRGTD